LAFGIHTEADVNSFAKVYFDPKATQDQLYALLAPVVERFRVVSREEQQDFRAELTDYVRLYAFLAQVLPFADIDLEKVYVFARHLRRLATGDRMELPREVQQNIDMESYRVQQTAAGKIRLDRQVGHLEPIGTKPHHTIGEEHLEPLSLIIAELNERFGVNLGPEHRVTLGQMMDRLDRDAGLDASARVNTRENVRLAFEQKVEDAIQEIVDTNFSLYKRITDDRVFGEAIKNFLFDQYLRSHRQAEELLKQGIKDT
jgi:type I restriction enzyme R subunit